MRGLTDLEREYLTECCTGPYSDEFVPDHLDGIGRALVERGLVDVEDDPEDPKGDHWYPALTPLGRLALFADAAARSLVQL